MLRLLKIFGLFLARILGSGLGWAFGAILGAIGIGFITYQGVEYLLNQLFITVQGHFYSLPEILISILLLLKFDMAIAIIFSAYATRAVLKNVWKGFTTISIMKGGS